MSRNLARPEEIDLILSLMADPDWETEIPVSGEAQSIGTIRNDELTVFAKQSGLSYGVVHQKSAHGLPQPELYVRRMY
jgi:hypothetical protein